METKAVIQIAYSPKRLESPGFWVGHIPFTFYMVPLLKPSIIVELSTYSGNSFFAFCQTVKENSFQAKCYAVDTWIGVEVFVK